jgi:hypothetical protein
MPKLTFAEWMKKVDASVGVILGCSVYDLEEIDFRAMYAAGATPGEAAWAAVINSDTFLGMLGL